MKQQPHSNSAMLFHAESAEAPLVLRANGIDCSAESSRSELLEKFRAGEFTGPLAVEAVTFVQRQEPNRNFSRFAKGTLRRGAQTFRNQVVLLDHAQRDQRSRIGTIAKSSAEKTADGQVAFRQTLSIVKPHAIESVLDGTIDRFSIGWMATGPIHCSVCKGPMFGTLSTCQHWPGEATADGDMPEAIYTAWEGIEVSAVNVPAVSGTGIEEIRAALAADRQDRNYGDRTPIRSKKMDLEVLRKRLGLAASATEGEILAALDAQTARITAAETEAELRRRAEEAARGVALSALISAAYADGRLEVARDPSGSQIPSELERQIRALPAGSAEAMLAALPRRHPNGQGLQSSASAPAPAGPARGHQVNPYLESMLDQVGLSMDDVLAYGPQHRLALNRDKVVAPRNLSYLFRTRQIQANVTQPPKPALAELGALGEGAR